MKEDRIGNKFRVRSRSRSNSSSDRTVIKDKKSNNSIDSRDIKYTKNKYSN